MTAVGGGIQEFHSNLCRENLVFTIHGQPRRGQLKALQSAVLTNPILSSITFVLPGDKFYFTVHHMVLEYPAPAGQTEMIPNRTNHSTECKSHFRANAGLVTAFDLTSDTAT